MPYTSLTSAQVTLPKAISPIGNPTWVSVKAPTTALSTQPGGTNFLVAADQDLFQAWTAEDYVTIDGIKFTAKATPSKPTEFLTGLPGVALYSLANAINRNPRFLGRYYAKVEFFGFAVYRLSIISLRPGAVFDISFSAVSPATGADLFAAITVTSGQGPTVGEDVPGYGVLINVWAQQKWKYLDGNSSWTPGVDATLLVSERRRYSLSGEYDFDISPITSTLLPDWLPELGFRPAPVDSCSPFSTCGKAGALAAYFVEAGQVQTVNGFRQEQVEYTSGPLFAWRGAIKALNPTANEHKRVTGIGLPVGRPQELLSSVFSPVGQDPITGDTPLVMRLSKSQPVQFISFLNTRIAGTNAGTGTNVGCKVKYTYRGDGQTKVTDWFILYGVNYPCGDIPANPDEADVYYARIDWDHVQQSYYSYLENYEGGGPYDDEEYPLIKADFHFFTYDRYTGDSRQMTETATVVYEDEGFQDDYQPTLVFRNHYGAYEAVQLRAGYNAATSRTGLDWQRALGRKMTFKDLIDFTRVQASETTFTLTSKPLSTSESVWLRELIASDRVFLYYRGPDYTITSPVRPPQAEMLLPLSVTDAKMQHDVDQVGRVLVITAKVSNTPKVWATPLTDPLRIKLGLGTGDGPLQPPTGGVDGGEVIVDTEPPSE